MGLGLERAALLLRRPQSDIRPAGQGIGRLAGGTARKAGWIELYDFIERGYNAFRQIKDVKAFVTTVEQRERRILDQIFAGLPDPFAL